MKRLDEAGSVMRVAGTFGGHRGKCASWLPGASIFDNLFVRVSAEVGRHSCEKGK
jgi:hypothetical protein